MMGLHNCEGTLPHDGYGEAIYDCTESADRPGEFWVSNGEYASQVAFCPYCGAEAPVTPPVLDTRPEGDA